MLDDQHAKLSEAAEALAKGDRAAAIAAIAGVLTTLGLASLLGPAALPAVLVAGATTKGLAERLAKALADTAAERMIAAGRDWDAEVERQRELVRCVLAALQVYLAVLRDDVAAIGAEGQDQFFQTIRYLEARVANREGQEQLLDGQQELLGLLRKRSDSVSSHGPTESSATTSIARNGQLRVDTNGPSCAHDVPGASYRRVRVTNLGAKSIENVEVKLAEFHPQGATFLPVRLHRVHDLSHPFDANPGDEIYIDVVLQPHAGGLLALCYDPIAYPLLPNAVEARTYTLTLLVTARDMPATRCQFVVDHSTDGRPQLRDAVALQRPRNQ